MLMCAIKPPFDKLRTYANMADYLAKNEPRIIRFWVYKRMFTPMEIDRKFIDQNCFETTQSRMGVIREVITLPDNDLLLGICEIAEEISELSSELRCMEYYKLSELRLAYVPIDDVEFGLVEAGPEVDA